MTTYWYLPCSHSRSLTKTHILCLMGMSSKIYAGSNYAPIESSPFNEPGYTNVFLRYLQKKPFPIGTWKLFAESQNSFFREESKPIFVFGKCNFQNVGKSLNATFGAFWPNSIHRTVYKKWPWTWRFSSKVLFSYHPKDAVRKISLSRNDPLWQNFLLS